MATDDRKVQLGVTVDATEARKGFGDVKDSARDMAQSVAQQGDVASKAISSIGDGGASSAQKVDTATRSMIGSIQRQIAANQAAAQAAEAGEQAATKGTAAYYDFLAVQRGLDPSKIGLWTGALRESEAALASMTSSLGGVDAASQGFLQSLQSQASALKEQVATFGMNRQELLAYQAAQLGAGESAASLISEISQLESALKAKKEAVMSASTAVSALGETEAEAAARIKEMVASSREAQAAMGAAASATGSAAASADAFGKSSEDMRATIAAQNAAMSSTAGIMATLDAEMAALTSGMTRGSSTFQELETQLGRLDLMLANGRMSTEEFEAAQASLWKNKDRLLAQTNALVDRYDVLGVATRKLASDEAALEDAYKSGQVTTAQYQKTMAGIAADQASVQLKALAQQEAQLEQQLKSGQISLASYKKELSTIGAQKADFSAIAGGASESANAMDALGTHTKAARTEILRLVNDLANGNMGRFDQSAMVLAEQFDVLEAAATPAGAAILGLVAGATAFAAAAIHVQSELDGMNQALLITGNYAGTTVSGLSQMAEAATAGGSTIDTATAAVTKLAATGRLTAVEISGVGQATADASTYMGVSVDKMVGMFTELAKEPAKASAELNEQYHYLTASTYEQIVALEKQGDATAAAQLAVETFATAVEKRSQDMRHDLGYVEQAWDNIKAAISGAIHAVGSFGAAQTDAQKLQTLNEKISKAQSSDIGFLDPANGAGLAKMLSDRDALLKKMKDDADVARKQGEQDDENDAKVRAQKAYAEWKKQFWNPQQKAAEEQKKYLDEIAGPLGLSPEQQLADEQNIADKYKGKSASTRGAGLIDKTQLTGEVQAVKDQLAQELSYVKSAQTQLDAQYKSGGLSESQFYQQSRDLIMQEASDKADAYNKEADLLSKGLSDQKMSAQQRAQILNQVTQLHAQAAAAIEAGMLGVADSAAKQDEALDKAGTNYIASLQKQIDATNKEDQSLKDQIDTFGMGKGAIDQLAASRADDQVAALEQGKAIRLLNNSLADTKPWDDAIEKAKELATALHHTADDQSALDQLKEQKKIADQTVQDWKSAANSIEQGLTTALMNGFEHGKSFGQSLADSLKSLFKTLVLQPIIAPIAGSMASLMYPGAAQAYAQTNPNSPLVGLASNGGLFSGVNGLIGSASGLFGGMSTSTAASVANAEGGDTLGNFLSLTGNAGKGAGAAGNAFSSVSSFLGAAGTGYGVGSIVGNLFGGGTAGTGSQVGGTVGGVAGSFIPIPGGTLIGSAIGSALGGLVGSLFGGGETRNGATYTTDGTTATKVGTGPSGGDPASEQVTQQINSTFQTIQSMASSLGGSIADLGTYHAGYEVSPKKGNSFVTAGFTTDPNEWDPGRVDLGGVKDSTTVLNDLSLQLQRSVIKSLQDANLDKPYADYLNQFDASSLSSDQVTQIETVLNELKTLFTAIQTMGSDFDNLKNASTDAQLAVINLSGGIDQFNTNASYFEQNFVPAAEQTANQAKAVKDQLAALGESSVTTNEQFRQAVQGIDLSTTAGQQLYAQMLALAPAFNTMTQAAAAAQQAAQEAADQQQSLWNNYYSAIYSSDQQAAVAQGQLKAQFDALGVAMPKTNAEFQALVENMDTSSQPMKDLQNALLALAPTFGQVASAAEQSTAAMQAAIGQAQKTAISTLSSSAQSLYTDKSNASSLLDSINSSITGSDADTSSQISKLWSEMTGGGVSLTQQIDLATQLNDLITKRYQAEGQAVSTLTDQVKQLRDYVQSLKAGDLSTETPSEKLADAAQLYADTLAKAQGGDQTAIGNLTTAADNYLKLAQTYYASSDTYTQIFASVTSQLSAFGDALDSQSKSSDQLSQESLDQLTKLRDIVAGQASSADAQYQGVMGQLAQQLSTLDAIEQAAGIQSEVPSILQGLPSEIAAELASIIGTGAATGGDQITSLYQSMLGRTPTANEVSYWTDSFANGSKTLSDFKYSADQELINNAYQQILGRAADSGGLQFYTDKLYSGSESLDQIKSDLQQSLINGSHAGGADNIPFDGYVAELHKGEAVVTSANNAKLSKMLAIDWSQYGTGNAAAMASGFKALTDRIGQLEAALVQATQQNAAVVAAETARSAQTIAAGSRDAVDLAVREQSAKPPKR